jgi:hypothetical protein
LIPHGWINIPRDTELLLYQPSNHVNLSHSQVLLELDSKSIEVVKNHLLDLLLHTSLEKSVANSPQDSLACHESMEIEFFVFKSIT